MLLKEGQVRIPSGCAISGFIHKDGKKEDGRRIIDSIEIMHERSNGLGGGFAGYGIYPDFADCYAFHVFYNTQKSMSEANEYIKARFKIVSESSMPTRKMKEITNEPNIWRYFLKPLEHKIAEYDVLEDEFVFR
ncbi:MAG: hypothetical protein LBM65_02370, partial [Oscillospiraceae bacterium]|nr:hypothetical protein [Oscillospiraceae bacterium]